MTGEMAHHTFIPQYFDVFAGLDVDKTSISVTFMNHRETIRSIRIAHSAEHLLNYVRKRFTDQKVAFAYEAGPTGYGLHDKLTDQGYLCLVAAASMIPRAPGQRVKTNRLDSQKLCEALRGGQLKSIHVPSVSYRQLRHLTQLRDTFIRQVAANKCRIKALLLFEGIAFPQAPPGSQWSTMVIGQLKQLSCPEAVRFKLDALLRNLQFAQQQALESMRQIRRFCHNDPELHRCIEYLRSIPGIGWIVASHLLARIGDWRQIQNVRQLSAFLGLVPTEHSTGETVQRGSITRSGDSRIRSKLERGQVACCPK
ncbi:MAG TPA: IS110 family transposase [Nitrospiria bacterium]|jgi:transposase